MELSNQKLIEASMDLMDTVGDGHIGDVIIIACAKKPDGTDVIVRATSNGALKATCVGMLEQAKHGLLH